jgi:Flp pilus assembly protein TadD
MKMRNALVALLLAATPVVAFDHADPLALHAQALERLRAGDLRTAEILLARAARLAPEDTRIARARDALRRQRAGESVTLEPPALRAAKPSPGQAPPVTVPPEPPPLWPLR